VQFSNVTDFSWALFKSQINGLAKSKQEIASAGKRPIGQSNRLINTVTAGIPLSNWLENYKQEHAALLQQDAEFARWLDKDYRPLAGGWQY
jgi:hypothetical protein